MGKWIGEVSCPVLLCVTLFLPIFQLKGPSAVICLRLKLVITLPSIIGWPAIDPTFTLSFQLNYIIKKKNNKCLACLRAHTFTCFSGKKNRLFCGALEPHVKQSHSDRLALLFSRWGAWQFKSACALRQSLSASSACCSPVAPHGKNAVSLSWAIYGAVHADTGVDS